MSVDGILGTHVTWKDIEDEFKTTFGINAKIGDDKKATSIGDMRGFMSRIALINPDWKCEDVTLPKSFIVKIASELAFVEFTKLLNSDKDEDVEAEMMTKIRPILKTLHNRECAVYQLLQKLNSPEIPYTKCYAANPFSDDYKIKAFLIFEALEDIEHIGVYENFQIEDVIPIVKSLATFSALGEILSPEELSFAASSDLLANLMAASSDEKLQQKCYDQMKLAFPDEYEKEVEKLIEIYKLYFSPKMLSKLGKVSDFVGHRKTLIHGDLWTSNLLCRKVSGRPQMQAIIDWQTVAFGSPGQDLARLFMNILSTNDRRQHLDTLLSVYYDTFVEKIGSKPMPFTLSQLHKSYQLMFAPLSVLVLPGIFPFLEHSQISDEMQDSIRMSALDKMVGLMKDVLKVHKKSVVEFPEFYE